MIFGSLLPIQFLVLFKEDVCLSHLREVLVFPALPTQMCMGLKIDKVVEIAEEALKHEMCAGSKKTS